MRSSRGRRRGSWTRSTRCFRSDDTCRHQCPRTASFFGMPAMRTPSSGAARDWALMSAARRTITGRFGGRRVASSWSRNFGVRRSGQRRATASRSRSRLDAGPPGSDEPFRARVFADPAPFAALRAGLQRTAKPARWRPASNPILPDSRIPANGASSSSLSYRKAVMTTRTPFFAAAFLTLLAPHISRAQVPAALRAAAAARMTALGQSDAAKWGPLTSDSFTVVATDGRSLTKVERIAQLKAGSLGQAWVPQHERYHAVAGGTAFVRRYDLASAAFIEVWSREKGTSRAADVQVTAITPDSAVARHATDTPNARYAHAFKPGEPAFVVA